MMIETTLSRRLTDSPYVRWMSGMVDTEGARVLDVTWDGRLVTSDWVCNNEWDEWYGKRRSEVDPSEMSSLDLSDRITVGCLYMLACERACPGYVEPAEWDCNDTLYRYRLFDRNHIAPSDVVEACGDDRLLISILSILLHNQVS